MLWSRLEMAKLLLSPVEACRFVLFIGGEEAGKLSSSSSQVDYHRKCIILQVVRGGLSLSLLS